jgi:hypothetical protein
MRHYAKLLALKEKTEIFPKQNSLTGKGVGSGISIPYRVGTLEHAFDAEGQPIECVDEFLDFCWARCFYGDLLLRDVPPKESLPFPTASVDDEQALTIEQIRRTYT